MEKVSTSQGSTSYWDGYYRQGQVPELPSQFALFVANELVSGALPPVAGVIDLGCGNGRDGLFLARQGYRLGGLDRSADAIEVCRKRLAGSDPQSQARARFEQGAADGDALAMLADWLAGPVLIYSRFFFHAVDDEAEARILERIGKVLGQTGGALAVEFRTTLDAAGAKETGEHYRRYVDPAAFVARLAENGLQTVWQAEGRGMAKYRSDDAHVARIVARPW